MSRPKRKFIDTLSEWCAEAPLSDMQRALDLLRLAVQWKQAQEKAVGKLAEEKK